MELIIDKLETCWSRLFVNVEAETKEEALEKYNKGEFEVTDSEILDFTGDVLDEIIMDENYDYLEEK